MRVWLILGARLKTAPRVGGNTPRISSATSPEASGSVRAFPVDKVSRQLGHRNACDFTHKTYIHDIEAYENRGRAVMRSLGGAFPGARVSLPLARASPGAASP